MTEKTKGAPRPTTGEQATLQHAMSNIRQSAGKHKITIRRPKYWYWRSATPEEPSPTGWVKHHPTEHEADQHDMQYGFMENAICQYFDGPVRREIIDIFLYMFDSLEEIFGSELFASEEDVEEVYEDSYLEARARLQNPRKEKQDPEEGGAL